MIPNVLTIAGSDPSGGAGIQADLKTFAALGTYGAAVITARTAQNTHGVAGVHAVPADFVALQLDTLFADVQMHATKIGMLANAETVVAVASALARHAARQVVLDPVMMAKGGDALVDASGVDAIRTVLLRSCTIVTPNLPEAGLLLGTRPPTTVSEMRSAARTLVAAGPRAVLMKGGHLDGPTAIDVMFDGETFHELESTRVATRNTHGTGCTLSAAIAALLASGADLVTACRGAKDYLTGALFAADSLGVGSGVGPVWHGW